MEFMVGDKIIILGRNAIVKEIKNNIVCRMCVEYENGDCSWVMRNSISKNWNIDIDIILVKRPKKKVKKKFYLGHDKYSPIHSYIGCGALWLTRKDAEVQGWEHVLEVEIEVEE